MCEGGEGFVPCEPLPRDPQTLLKKGAHVENGEREERKENDQTSTVPAANRRASPDR